MAKKKFKEYVYDDTRYKGKYGFIEIKNPAHEYDYTQEKYLIRKPTPQERKEIILNYIIDKSGKRISINSLAKLFAVSDRTIQKVLNELRDDNLIEIVPTFKKDGTQHYNVYKYIGEPINRTGKELTIKLLLNPKNPYGFRDFDWNDYKFDYDGYWYDNSELEEVKNKNEAKRRKFLNDNQYDYIKLNVKYYHSIRGKDGIYTVLKSYNIMKKYELINQFSFEFYEFEIAGKAITNDNKKYVELYSNNKLLGKVNDNKNKEFLDVISYQEDGRIYANSIEIEARLL